MESFEGFTQQEIVEIFEEICDVIEIEVEDYDEDGLGGVSLDCESLGINFRCHLNGSGPFFDQLSLLSLRTVEGNPLYFCNRFNSGGGVARTYLPTPLDDEDTELQDEDGNTFVFARLFINFGGGVTKDHVSYLLNLWIEDLYDFNDVEFEDDEKLPELDFDFQVPPDLSSSSLPLIERVIAFLTLNGPRNAREIAKALRVDRQKINRLLYKGPKSFSKSSAQPPIWSINNEDV
jgi:hypothetical protein